jgi:hypothetical protein
LVAAQAQGAGREWAHLDGDAGDSGSALGQLAGAWADEDAVEGSLVYALEEREQHHLCATHVAAVVEKEDFCRPARHGFEGFYFAW